MGHPFDERLERVDMEEIHFVPGTVTVLLFEDAGFSLRPDLRDVVAEAIDAAGDLSPGVTLYRFTAE